MSRSARPDAPSSKSVAGSILGLTRWVDRAYGAFTVVRDEVALAACTGDVRSATTTAIYSRADKYGGRSEYPDAGFFEFEDRVVRRFFPRPPARVLVPACGAGREVLELLRRGYQIAGAYDPVPQFVDDCAARVRPSGAEFPLWVGTHQGFSRGSFPSVGPVDAVLVGWGSYTHLLGGPARVSFLRALRGLGPRAPVALSFFAPFEEVAGSPRSRLRAHLRAGLRRLRVGPPSEPGDAFRPGAGFVHYFDRERMVAEAAAAGYSVAHYEDHHAAYPHAVLIPG